LTGSLFIFQAQRMKNRVLLVDGHSAIFQSKELGALHTRQSSLARHRLVQLLTRYADATGVHVAVVFDGRGSQISKDHIPDGIQIFYSKSGQAADAVIERLVAKYSTHYEIRVATDDYLERQTVESFGGHWLSIGQLFVEIQNADTDLEFRLRQLRSPRK
jgi:predicted RNA-binding protein with PIN domain